MATNKIVFKFADSNAKTLNLNIQSTALKPQAQVTEAGIKTVMQTLLNNGWGRDTTTKNSDGTYTVGTKNATSILGASYTVTDKEEITVDEE